VIDDRAAAPDSSLRVSPRIALGVAAGLALQALMLGGGLVLAPAWLRITVAFATLILLPGYALVFAGARAPGGAWLTPAWALGFGIAWNSLLLLATLVLDVPFTMLLPWTLATTAVAWVLALAWTRVRVPMAASTPPDRLSGLARALVIVAASLALLHVARLGAPLMIYTDSPDHIGTIRRMIETGHLFPNDAFFRDAGTAGADPRKGLWHGQVAWIAMLAHADPIVVWRDLAACVAPFFVLAAAALGFLVRGGAGASIAAWTLLLTYGGGLGQPSLREAVYATKLADQLALSTAVAVLFDLARPSRLGRLAAIALGFAAVTTHVFASLEFAIVFGALGLGLLLRDRGISVSVRRLIGTTLAIALVCLPYVVWRARHTPPAVNPIHTEPQGLLWLGDHLHVVSIGVLWEWLGLLWLVVPFAWIPLWRRGRANAAVLYLLTTSVAVALVMFDPLVVGWLVPRIGYLTMRMIWIVPLAGVIAWVLPELVTRIRTGSGSARRSAIVAFAAVVLFASQTVGRSLEALARPDAIRRAEAEDHPLAWRPIMDWITTHLPPGQVILSDPGTSYAVPMMTHDYVVTLLDQHSSPSDSLALRRILAARDALDPYGRWSDTRDVVRRYGVDLVLLNGAFRTTPWFDYWGPGPEWFRATRSRLDGAPAAFEPLAELGGAVLYRVHREALDTLASPPVPRPFVEHYEPNRFAIAVRTPDARPVLHRLGLVPLVVAPGDTVHAEAQWRALDRQPPGSYLVAVRFDRSLPWGLTPPPLVAKPVRKLVERARGELYRFRSDHLPVGGRYSVDAWQPDEVVRDSFVVVIPHDAAEGRYLVRIKMLHQPHYVNFRLGDYFLDDDYYTGLAAARIEVRRSRRPEPFTPAEAAAEGGH
jgi:hypothetical protein